MAKNFHVLELASLDRASLTPAERALAELPAQGWQALTRGDDVVLTGASLVMAEHGPLGLAKVRVHDRQVWEAFARRAGAALVPRASSMSCARPASPNLCWEPLSLSARFRTARTFTTAASTALLAVASLAVLFVLTRERRRAHSDRIHVLRTLTHELRTPATSLRIDIEPLRAAYDALPASCQEPLLRISDGIERLQRVLHRTARYMALFETPGSARSSLLTLRTVPSVRALFEDLTEEWPEGVTVQSSSTDGAIVTDPEWLGIALRNLVENASRHGKPPVTVTWELSRTELVVRVVDQGTTPVLVLRNAINPFERAARSEGLGLGLAIVAKVAELLRGRLSHQAKPTAFELRVPARSVS